MLKPITLGNKTFPLNLIQGPLAGISCAPFRTLTSAYKNPAFACTEMLSSSTIQHAKPRLLKRFVTKDDKEGPVCFQLSGNNARDLAEATKRVTDLGADLIDLNCGCPVNKIRRKGAGSALLAHPDKLATLIEAMKTNTHVPVSIKIRVDGGSDDKHNQMLCDMLNHSGVDYVIVHGRHWTEHYETPCRYNQIKFFVNALKMPVIGNGDVKCLTSLKTMFATGCAGAMIARAGVGQPWLIAKLIAECNGETFALPDANQIKQLFLDHVLGLSYLLANEKQALLQARKFVKYYARNLDYKIDLIEKVNTITSISQLERVIHFI